MATKEQIIARRQVATRRHILSTHPIFYTSMMRDSQGSNKFLSDDGYGHLCTVTGAAWTPQGRLFTGGDDYIIPTDNPAFEGMGQLVLEGWVKLGSNASVRTFIGKHWSGTDGSYFININGAGDSVTFATINSTPARIDHAVTYTMSTTAFTHVRAVYNGAIMWIEVNGVQVGNTSAQTGTIQVNTRGLAIGAIDTTGSSPLYGTLGEVWIYDKIVPSNYLATKWRYR